MLFIELKNDNLYEEKYQKDLFYSIIIWWYVARHVDPHG
jgi:hypothetical protein